MRKKHVERDEDDGDGDRHVFVTYILYVSYCTCTFCNAILRGSLDLDCVQIVAILTKILTIV